MTIARITTWADGQVLTAPTLNAEFDGVVAGVNALGAPVGLSRVTGLTGTIILNIGSFAAQGYVFQSTANVYSMTATSSYSINTQTAGPIINGRDQLAVFASTDVHFYALSTGTGSTAAAGICSTRPPPLGPTMLTSYVGWTYLGTAKYNITTSVTTANVAVRGNMLYARGPSAVLSSGGDITALDVLVDLTSYVPSIAPSYLLSVPMVGGTSPAAGGILNVDHYVRATAAGDAVIELKTLTGTAVGAQVRYSAGQHAIPNLNTPPSCYYAQAVNTGTSAALTLKLAAYTVPNGDAG